MTQPKLFMLLLGCRPAARFTEQHDIFFAIGTDLKSLVPDIKNAWPEAKGNVHIDAWREVTCVDGYSVEVVENVASNNIHSTNNVGDLYFINLGGYKENEFEEFHYKLLVIASGLDTAKTKAKKTAFFKHTTLAASTNSPKATSHIDDKYGIDVDDVYNVEDILSASVKNRFNIRIGDHPNPVPDEFHLGYFRLTDL